MTPSITRALGAAVTGAQLEDEERTDHMGARRIEPAMTFTGGRRFQVIGRRPGARRARRSFGTALLVGLFVALVGANAALAASGYTAVGTFAAGPGSADGELTNPQRVAVENSTGRVFVVDSGNDRVQVFDPAGASAAFLTSFGAGILDAPYGIAIDQASGDVYVSDAGNGRVVRFQSDGNPTPTYSLDGTFTSPLAGSGAGRVGNFAAPLAVAPDGDLLLADRGNNRIQRYDSTGSFDSAFTGADTPEGTFKRPLDLTVVPGSGDVVVVDSTGDIVFDGNATSRVLRFNPDGTYQASLGPVPSAGLVTIDPNTGYTVVVGNLVWFAGPRLYVFDGTAPVTDNPFPDAVNGGAVTGVAVDGGATGRLYTASDLLQDCCGVVGGQVFDVAEFPTPVVDPASAITETAATLSGTVNPNGTPTGYHFEYSTDGSNWTCVPGCVPFNDADVGDGTVPVAVQQTITGLESNTSYQFRLIAINSGGKSTVDGTPFVTLAAPPAVATLGAGEIGTTTASIAGRVDPNNSPTTYQFEYGTTTAYGQTAPATPGDAGSGGGAQTFAETIAGLELGTTYHYRIVAENSAGRTEGQDRSFTTSAQVPAPPGRGYEQVSDVDKTGYDVFPHSYRAVSPAGDRAIFGYFGALPDDQAGAFPTMHRSMRTTAGWSAQTALPTVPPAGGLLPSVWGVSDDLAVTVIRSTAKLTADALEGHINLYRRNADDSYTLLTPNASDDLQARVSYAGASSDFSHIVFNSTVPQIPGAPSGVPTTYEWVNGDLRLVGVLPDDTQVTTGTQVGSNGFFGSIEHAISGDGSRIFFHVVDPTTFDPGGSAQGQIYVRENGTVTKHVTASQRTVPDTEGPFPAQYITADANDGSAVLFSSCEKLTNDSTASNATPDCSSFQRLDTTIGRDLYLYDVETSDLTDITAGDPQGSGLMGVVGQSDDLSRIYFVAQGNLADGATRGENNLYVWDHGTTRYIATLSGEPDTQNSNPFQDAWNWRLRGNQGDLKARSVRVTSDGSTLVFASRARVTSYDSASASCAEGRCAEMYMYRLASDQLQCISCPPAGGAPAGDSFLSGFDVSGLPLSSEPFARNLTEDGSRLYFETPEKLVGGDSNGKTDVYSWQGGAVTLLSSGTGNSEAHFSDASVDGGDVFFTTRQRLVATDKDDNVDLYDARAGGGFPVPPATPPCAGEDCQGPGPNVPGLPSPGSEAFTGPGNSSGKRAAMSVKRLSASQLSQLAKGKRVVVKVKVNRSGKVSLVARAKLGKTARVVARGSKQAARAGTVGIGLRLSKTARTKLATGDGLKVALTIRFAGLSEPERMTVNLKGARRATATATGNGR